MSECARPRGHPRARRRSARQLDARATRRARVDAPSAREGEAALEARARGAGRGARARDGGRSGVNRFTHSFILSFVRARKRNQHVTRVNRRRTRRAIRCGDDSVRALYVYRCSPSGGTFDRDAQKEYHRERGRARVFRTFRRALDEVCFLSVFKRRVVSFVDRRCVILDPPSPIVREKVCLFVLYHSRASRASLGFILRSHPSC